MKRLLGGIAALAGAVLFPCLVAAANPGFTGVTVRILPPSGSLTSVVSMGAGPVTAGQQYMVMLTVSNNGAGAVANVSGTMWISGGQSASYGLANSQGLASLSPFSAVTFTWTATAGLSGTESWTGSATGGGVTSVPTTASMVTQAPPVITATLAAAPTVGTGGSFLLTLTVANSGQASANVSLLPAAFQSSGSGTVVTPFVGPAPAMPVLVASGATVTLTWTVTAGDVGSGLTISNTVYVTDANGGPALASIVVNTGLIAVVDPGTLVSRLSFTRLTAALGQPVEFVLSVTNTGGSAVSDLTARLRTDGYASIGMPMPASVATLAPGALATFTWTVAPSEIRALNFFATAAGFTLGATGIVPVAAAQATALLPGIVVPGAGVSYVYPSPARDSAGIAYTMAESGTVRIRVYNASGQLVTTLEESKSAGVQSTTITASLMAPGVYLYILERHYGSGSSDKIGPRKFVVAR
jgi:hypothetical protein